jgi:hypothetical protein
MVCAMVKCIDQGGMVLRLIRIKRLLDSRSRGASPPGSEAKTEGLLPGREEDAATRPSEVRCAEIRRSPASLVVGR